MGQKVHPYGFRLGIIRDTRSKWFAEGAEYREQLVEDLTARKMIHERHHHAGISNILIERAADTTTVTIESAKPGIVIGRGGSDVDRLRRDLDEVMDGRVRVNVEETKSPETSAQLIAEEIAGQIERRASIRRAMSQAIDRAMRVGVDGIRVAVSGRLMGAEIARTERMGPVGSVPLHTLRADVEKGFSEAVTGYGHIGVQVYVCNGEILPPPPSPPEGQQEAEEAEEPEAPEQPEEAPAAAETAEAETEEAAEAPAAETEAAAEPEEAPASEKTAEAATEETAEAPAAEAEEAAETATEAPAEAATEETAEAAPEETAEEAPAAEPEGAVEEPAEQIDELLAEGSDSASASTEAAGDEDEETPAEEDTGDVDA